MLKMNKISLCFFHLNFYGLFKNPRFIHKFLHVVVNKYLAGGGNCAPFHSFLGGCKSKQKLKCSFSDTFFLMEMFVDLNLLNRWKEKCIPWPVRMCQIKEWEEEQSVFGMCSTIVQCPSIGKEARNSPIGKCMHSLLKSWVYLNGRLLKGSHKISTFF